MSEVQPVTGTVERRIERLEAIVTGLERDDLELDAALKLFEEGVGHLRELRGVLEAAELRVEKLLDDLADDEDA